MKVSEAIADALAIEAGGPIFGLMGDANMAVWDVLGADDRTRMVSARCDGAAVLMADGYARATGRIGVATVTCGPGLANCANALVTASRGATPLVVYTGEYTKADGGLGLVQSFDQSRFAQACEVEYRRLDRLENLAEDIAEGFFTARTKKRPVILSVPAPLWDEELPWEWEYQPSTSFLPEHYAVSGPLALRELADKLQAAERPVIIAGRGAVSANARHDIELLAEHTGSLLATSLLAKGFFDGHPYDIGVSGLFSSCPTERLMAQADFVLGIGASLNFFTCEGGTLFSQAQVARIDVKPLPVEIGATPGLYLQGDALETTRALLRVLLETSKKKEGFRSAATRQILNEPTPQSPNATDGLDPRELMRSLSRSLPLNTQVISGGGHFWSWPVAHLALPAGGRYQHTIEFGSIGLAVAHGIGAAVGNPQRTTLVIEGDGSFLQGIQELHAAAELRIPVIFLVMNDSGYGAEVRKMQWKHRNPRDAMWTSPDYVSVARGLGGDGVLLERESDVAQALKRAIEFKGPFVIDARISPSLVSDSESRLYLGLENSAPLLRPLQARDKG